MKKQPYLRIILLLCCITVLGCKMPASPEKYFDAAALNANAVSHFGSDYFITALEYGKRTAGAGQYSYEQQIGFAIQRVERYLKSVNGLIATKDTEALLDASKDLFQFTLESYRTDHMAVAKMIDRKAPEEEIAKALEALDQKSYGTFVSKYNKLHDLGTQYAKDHDIKLVEMPRFNR
ncbi:MAG TPA: hypothetical protein VIM87_06530 [Chitinophaga sp.]|uniref:hypothetical protein n=1 Tax=Chitinophaga sp. TaxID=1869181 RepID=UPI002F924F64